MSGMCNCCDQPLPPPTYLFEHVLGRGAHTLRSLHRHTAFLAAALQCGPQAQQPCHPGQERLCKASRQVAYNHRKGAWQERVHAAF